ncbi:hypothetical protein [Chitinimonas koreensis]|uniref:hypothetical protein n=1 Tax=Chitinimonas koreensis TaxID=356302 RepID=UPI00223FE2CB|nr:hypothetical protein [Chitinimonas koreensis]
MALGHVFLDAAAAGCRQRQAELLGGLAGLADAAQVVAAVDGDLAGQVGLVEPVGQLAGIAMEARRGGAVAIAS